MKKEKEMTWHDAIEFVLKDAIVPLHFTEITEKIISEGLRASLGATPASTVSAYLSTSVKHEKEKSPYIKISKGTYGLRRNFSATSVSSTQKGANEDSAAEGAEEEQYAVLTSLGMYWSRNAVEWSGKSKLLGQQNSQSENVDFWRQLGIYLLYDGREVIYVGRAEKNIGERLYQHTKDRLATRWDRFSWFGLLPVSENGALEAIPATYQTKQLIPALEAILIEALEPRQNRKRGDELSAVEYTQVVDPAIETRRKKAILQELSNRI